MKGNTTFPPRTAVFMPKHGFITLFVVLLGILQTPSHAADKLLAGVSLTGVTTLVTQSPNQPSSATITVSAHTPPGETTLMIPQNPQVTGFSFVWPSGDGILKEKLTNGQWVATSEGTVTVTAITSGNNTNRIFPTSVGNEANGVGTASQQAQVSASFPKSGQYRISIGVMANWWAGTGDAYAGNSNVLVLGMVVEGDELQYQLPGGDWRKVTSALYVPKGTVVHFRVHDGPDTWPVGKPAWSGSSGAAGTGASKDVQFSSVSSGMSDVKSVVVEGQRTHTASIVTYDADDATLDVKFANNDITSGQITARAQFTVWGWDANNDYVADSTGGTIKIRLPETVNSETDITLSDIATITYENGVAQDRTYAYLDGLWNLAEDVTTGLGADDGNEGELAMLDSGKDYFHQLKETRKSKAILCQIQAAAPTVAALVKEALITTAVGTAASQAVEIVKQSNVATTVLIEVDRAAGSRIILNQNTEFAMSTAASGYYVSFKDSWCTRDPRAYMSAVAAPASITVGNNNVQAQTLSVIWTNDKDYKDYNGYTGGNKRDASINGIGKRSAAIDNDIGRFLAAVYYTNYNAFKFTKTVGAGGVKSTWFSSNSNPPHGPETDYIQLNAKIHWRRSP